VLARGQGWPVYDTPLGRIGMLIRYDLGRGGMVGSLHRGHPGTGAVR
jgi:hypothetical protein